MAKSTFYPSFDLDGLSGAEYNPRKISDDDLQTLMEQNKQTLNATLPAYCKISAIKIQEDEFEKTPKKSIKRYLYQ